MSVDLDSDQNTLRDSIRKYLAKEVEPQILECERNHAIPLDIFRGLIQFGYQGGQLPEADGGLDVPLPLLELRRLLLLQPHHTHTPSRE